MYEAVVEWTDEKVEGLISLGTALLLSMEGLWIALTTPLRLISLYSALDYVSGFG